VRPHLVGAHGPLLWFLDRRFSFAERSDANAHRTVRILLFVTVVGAFWVVYLLAGLLLLAILSASGDVPVVIGTVLLFATCRARSSS
jgi:hypothetical protein